MSKQCASRSTACSRCCRLGKGAAKMKSPGVSPRRRCGSERSRGQPVVFLARHDQGHRPFAHRISTIAPISMCSKRAAVTDMRSLSACGSFKRSLPPGTFVLVDQFVDRSFNRESSFFGKGCVAHVSMAHPSRLRSRSASPPPAAPAGNQARARRRLRLHRGAAVLNLRGEA